MTATEFEAIERRVWTEVQLLLTDTDRLLALADEYLGVRSQAAEDETDRLAALDREVAELEAARVRAASDAIRAGLDPGLLREVVEGIDRNLARLVADRDRIEAVRADQQAAQDRAVAIARLAERAQRRLIDLDLEGQREALALLGVRVTVLDQTTNPRPRIEGDLGGGDLFGSGDDPDGPDTPGDTPRRMDPQATGRLTLNAGGLGARHLPDGFRAADVGSAT